MPVPEGAAMSAREGFASPAERYFTAAGFGGTVLLPEHPGSGKPAAYGTA
jgi:hypothetical protein